MNKNLFTFLLFLSLLSGQAQTGPGGVGTPANNVLWLKADAGITTSVSGTPISLWSDQSGNAIDVTQTVSAQQPSFVTNVMNGLPSIQFDNVNGANQNDKMIGPDSPVLDNTSGYTFFHVTRLTNTGDARVILSKRTAVSVNQSFMLFYYTANELYVDIQTTNDRFSSNTVYSTNTNYLGTLIYNGTVTPASSRCTLYNAEAFDRNATETSTIVPDNTSPLLIGTTDASDPRPFGGYISEVIVYREALGNAQRILINNYLSAKYNIALSANDRYAGDTPANGDYDRQVAGVGQESTGSSSSFSPSASGGIGISVNSGLDNGDYVMVGHALATNTTINTDVGGMTGVNPARWQRVWYVDVTNTGAGINANIEFDMSDGGMGTFTLGPVSNYVLLYRAGQTGNWTEVATASSISGDRIIFSGISGTVDGYLTLGTRNLVSSPLPIELIDFKASPQNEEVKLHWSTASEKNNQYFHLEKSEDGLHFETFATVPGERNSKHLKKYEYTDKQPYAGVSYYRLKQTDYDGKFSFSDVFAVHFEGAGGMIVFPNPNQGSFKIKLHERQLKEIHLRLTSAAGEELFSDIRLLKNAEGYYEVHQLGELAAGVYTITVSAGQNQYSHKLIIK